MADFEDILKIRAMRALTSQQTIEILQRSFHNFGFIFLENVLAKKLFDLTFGNEKTKINPSTLEYANKVRKKILVEETEQILRNVLLK